MYGKIFDTMYQGTLYGKWEAIVTMQQLIVLCDADGVIDMTPQAIAARTSIPREIIDKGLTELMAPDPYTRTEGSDGVRIALLDDHRPWGWYIVNHEKYRDMANAETVREQNRVRQQTARDKKKSHGTSRNVTTDNGPYSESRHTDTDTDTNTDKPKDRSKGFEQFWNAYPTKVKKKTARAIWMRKNLDPDLLISDIKDRQENDQEWIQGFIPHPTTYLNGERWNDAVQAKPLSELDRVLKDLDS
jgi:hypothetical protein